MNHIIWSATKESVVLYDDEAKVITDVDDEFTHALIQMMTNGLKSKGKILDKIYDTYCAFMYKIGFPRPEFFCEHVISDNNTGTKYRIIMEIYPGAVK